MRQRARCKAIRDASSLLPCTWRTNKGRRRRVTQGYYSTNVLSCQREIGSGKDIGISKRCQLSPKIETVRVLEPSFLQIRTVLIYGRSTE